ncbi:hypothetical protein CIRG_07657 [Coccidioides immitis RMSCC 2394]|uniref:Uncharacterized protein n=1 Tax=Coccidioides immitis RMSCC 2394 TaxID=404692 RepID=A0A0J6YH02_COCIT|nr:hypothetical protein CIRG_07657 [Coccidioides immitis RMSCC 2394]
MKQDHDWFRKLLCPVTKNMNITGNVLPLSHFRRWLKQSCSVIAMTHCKHITVNTDNMKLVLGISAKIRLNYFGLIDASDCSAPVIITCCLHTAFTLSTTAVTTSLSLSLFTTASLSSSSAVRVSTCQIISIRVPVQFTKPVLEKQKKKKKKKKKKKQENEEEEREEE